MAFKSNGNNLAVGLNQPLDRKKSKSDTTLDESRLTDGVSKSTSSDNLRNHEYRNDMWRSPPIVKMMKSVPVKKKSSDGAARSRTSLPALMKEKPIVLITKSPLQHKLSLDSTEYRTHLRLQQPAVTASGFPNKKPLAPLLSLDSTLAGRARHEQGLHGCGTSRKPDDSVKINMLAIVWFHPTLTRHQAEAELHTAEEGVYLLRPRREGGQIVEGFSLDVRSSHSVKHFRIDIENGDLVLGEQHFSDLESFLEHFDNQPMLGDGTGHPVVCLHPYPREVDELHEYYVLSNHFVPAHKSDDSLEKKIHSLASKEGYLFKMGQRVKSWKRRWFVLKDTYLQYFATEKDMQPIKTILLKEAIEVDSCEIPGKSNTFQIVLPNRTFYMEAPCSSNRDEWIIILQFKLDELKRNES